MCMEKNLRVNIAQKSERKGLKLLISMPVDSFDYPGPCLLLLSLVCAFCLLALDRNGLERSSEL